MIKVAYDHQTFTQQRYGGISRIYSEISSLIHKTDEFEVSIYAGLYQNIYLSEKTDLEIKGRHILYPPKSLKLMDKLNTIFCKMLYAIDQPDIVHETYYSRVRSAPKKVKTVITVLDMIHEKFLNDNDNKNFLDTKSIAISRADHVICISENTRKDLLEIMDLPPEKISTVYLGHSLLNENFESKPFLEFPYILYVGHRVPEYKNFERLLKAYGSKKNIQKDFKLVCFGPTPFSDEELQMIKDLEIKLDDVLYYSGNDSVLENLYTHAEVFIYPSLYEGFGIPPLEAMSLRCPVICSRISSIPEVVGDAGEYFDPYDIESIGEAIEKVVTSTSHKKTLVTKGCERVKLFTWEKCANQTAQIYRNLI
jgi:glycosyltransferase involved in cell wall biosynthesis